LNKTKDALLTSYKKLRSTIRISIKSRLLSVTITVLQISAILIQLLRKLGRDKGNPGDHARKSIFLSRKIKSKKEKREDLRLLLRSI